MVLCLLSILYVVKMVQNYHVEGYENFCKFIKEFDSAGKKVFVYFSGSKLPSGESWCDDCVRAWPVIKDQLEKTDPGIHFIYVEVGDRPTWKDPKCSFRTDPKTRLMVLPTITKWGTPQKLEGDQCEKPDLLSLIFGDDDED